MRALPDVYMKSPTGLVNAQEFTPGGCLGDVSVQLQFTHACVQHGATSSRRLPDVKCNLS